MVALPWQTTAQAFDLHAWAVLFTAIEPQGRKPQEI